MSVIESMKRAREQIAALGKTPVKIMLNPTEYGALLVNPAHTMQPGEPGNIDGVVVHRSLFAPDGGLVVFSDGSMANLKDPTDVLE